VAAASGHDFHDEDGTDITNLIGKLPAVRAAARQVLLLAVRLSRPSSV
jgi:hypothetical protein